MTPHPTFHSFAVSRSTASSSSNSTDPPKEASLSMRVLSLDADDGSLAFGLHQVDSDGVSTIFERVVGMARPKGRLAHPVPPAGPGPVKEAILNAVKLAFEHGHLDAVGCRLRQQAADAAPDGPNAAMAASLEAMEFAMELLPGVPVVAVFDADIANVEPSESPLDESTRIAVSAYQSAAKAER